MFSHRNTIPIIKYLIKNTKYKIFVDGNVDKNDKNTISPNLNLLIIHASEKIKDVLKSENIDIKRSIFISKLNKLLKNELIFEMEEHCFYFNILFNLILERKNF